MRGRARLEGGFTLVELLVIVTMLGILAGTALPLLAQHGRASDAEARANLRTAEQAIEAYSLQEGSYARASMTAASGPRSLRLIEPSLSNDPVPRIMAQGDNSYTLEVVSTSSRPVTYTIVRSSNGDVRRSCSPPATAGCGRAENW